VPGTGTAAPALHLLQDRLARDDARRDSVSSLTDPDPGDLLDEARDLQRRFETVRRRHLPRSLSWGSGPCDDTVGRMCWRHGSGTTWLPEPEDPAVSEARGELLAELARIGSRIPEDPWVLGQRVFYLVEAHRLDEARELAARCGPTEVSWCRALEGYVLHDQGRYPAAEEAFRRSLEAGDRDRAWEWTGVEEILDGYGRDVVDDSAAVGPEAHDRAYALVWRLADPFYLVPGNDRLTEHFARWTAARIRSEARNPHGIPWGDDLTELLVRYGRTVSWEKVDPRPGELGSGSVVGHEHPESRSFMPPGWVIWAPSEVEPGAWVPRTTYAPAAYAPLYAPVTLPADGDLAVFPRGDRVALAAAVRLPEDTTVRARTKGRPPHDPPPAFREAERRAGLFVVPVDGDTVFAATTRASPEGVAHLFLEVPATPSVISLEVVDPAAGRAGRLRHGLPLSPIPPDLATLSDLLLLDGEGDEPGTLEEALPHRRLDARVRPGDRIRVAWEVNGLGFRPETLTYHLSLETPEGGFFHRAGRWLGIVGDDPTQALGWEEPGPETPRPVFRSVEMELPEVDPGSYLLRLELGTVGRGTLVAERRIEVVTRR
jgi:hypothetical protein